MTELQFIQFLRLHGDPIGRTDERINGSFPSVTPDGFSCLTGELLPAGTVVRLWAGERITL